jgi:pimeloyl-ACP methyl ester carboxylesterase
MAESAITFVLIPGAGGSAFYWHRLVEELQRRWHATVAVDLPAQDPSAGLEEYADAVVEAVGDRTGLVVVAQSMGGFTAPLIVDRVPVEMIVLLNAMTPTPGESPGEWWENTRQAEARAEQARREGRDPDAGFDPIVEFLHDVPADVTAALLAEGPRDQADAPFEKPWPLEKWPDVPTRFLQGRDDRFFPLDFQRRVVGERLGIPVDEMPGGHLVALSRPVELADRLEAYARER